MKGINQSITYGWKRKDQVTLYKSCHLQTERYIITKSATHFWQTSWVHFSPMYVLPDMCREKAQLFNRSCESDSNWPGPAPKQKKNVLTPGTYLPWALMFKITFNHIFNRKVWCSRERGRIYIFSAIYMSGQVICQDSGWAVLSDLLYSIPSVLTYPQLFPLVSYCVFSFDSINHFIRAP